MSENPHGSGRLRARWDDLRTGLWFVPSLMMGAGVLVSAVALWLDRWLGSRDLREIPQWIYVSSAEEARNVLSTLLSSMITMTTLVFSITMVVLTLAANQFGPRLVRNFMGSFQTQVVLGTFAMTILYCLIALSAVGLRDGDGDAPFGSVSVAIALTGFSIVLLVLFIHFLARSIVSETLIDRVGRELDELLGELDPLTNRAGTEPAAPEAALPPGFAAGAARFGTDEVGYVQAVEFDHLVEIGHNAKVVIGLYFRAGDYLARGGHSLAIHPSASDTPELRAAVREAIALGIHRTPVQDPEYSIRHLVEIAVRALSPAVNDPYTAVAVVDRLSASLALAMERALPPGVWCDDTGTVRVVCPAPSHASLIGAAFDQIRQNSADKPLLVIHQIQALSRIAEHATLPAQFAALRHQLATLAHDAEQAVRSGSDRETLRTRIDAVMATLPSPDAPAPVQPADHASEPGIQRR